MCFFVFTKQKGPDRNLDPMEKGGATRQLRCVIGHFKYEGFIIPHGYCLTAETPIQTAFSWHIIQHQTRKDRTSVLSFFLDCRRNNQQTKTDRFTERSAIKTPSATRGGIAGNSWKKKKPTECLESSRYSTQAEKIRMVPGSGATGAEI